MSRPQATGQRFEREQTYLYTEHEGKTYKVYSDEMHEQRLAALWAVADSTSRFTSIRARVRHQNT